MYIFRWKEPAIDVTTSRAATEEDVWTWAIEWLRPWNMKDDEEAGRYIHKNGEVVKERE